MKLKKKSLNKNARAWVAALRSGRFKQGKNRLEKLDGGNIRHCCLGVACRLFIENGGKLGEKMSENGTDTLFGGHDQYLPGKVIEWLGLQTNQGEIDGQSSLAKLNDEGASFREIADIIESQPQGLFV